MISFTETAVAKVKEFAASMPEAEGKRLRVFIQPGGCSGLSYGFTFDDEREGDTIVDADESLKVLVDQHSAPLLVGSKVDFVDDHRGTGFSVENPNQAAMGGGCSGCSCG